MDIVCHIINKMSVNIIHIQFSLPTERGKITASLKKKNDACMLVDLLRHFACDLR